MFSGRDSAARSIRRRRTCSACLETQWILSRWPKEDEHTYQTTRLDYTGAGQLWLARRFTTEYNLLGESWNEPVMQQIREFRYSGVGRARYWVRERDPETTEVTAQTWSEYFGDGIAKDLDYVPGDPEDLQDAGSFSSRMRYVRGYGAGGTPGLVGIIDDAGGGSGTPPSNWYFVHADMLGSTRLITNSSGDAAGAMCYTAFGIPLGPDGILDGDDEPAGAIATRYAWCGGWGYDSDDLVDPSTADDFGMIHIGARWYDPTIGRFLQRDPIGIAGGLNAYLYVGSAPTGSIDPSGEQVTVGAVVVTAMVVAIIATIVYDVISNGQGPAGGTGILAQVIGLRTAKSRLLSGQVTTKNVWSRSVLRTYGQRICKYFRIGARGTPLLGWSWELLQMRDTPEPENHISVVQPELEEWLNE